MLESREDTIYRELDRAKAIRQEINYGSYKLLVVDEDALGGRRRRGAAGRAARRPEYDHIQRLPA